MLWYGVSCLSYRTNSLHLSYSGSLSFLERWRTEGVASTARSPMTLPQRATGWWWMSERCEEEEGFCPEHRWAWLSTGPAGWLSVGVWWVQPPPMEPHQAVLPSPLLLVKRVWIMGCLAGITGESLKCLHKPVWDTFSHLFGHLSWPVKGFGAKLASAGLLA